MHYQQGHDRDQVFMTSMDQVVPEDSFARIIDLFVDAMPYLPYSDDMLTHSILSKLLLYEC